MKETDTTRRKRKRNRSGTVVKIETLMVWIKFMNITPKHKSYEKDS